MARIKIIISPTWTIHEHELFITIDDEELADMEDGDREAYIEETAAEAVSEACPWGWGEVR